MAETRELESVPGMRGLYGKALLGVTARPTLGRLPGVGARFGGGEKRLPDTRLRLAGVEIDRGHVRDYDRVCGFHVSDVLPPTYPHMLTFPLQMQLMTGNDFPFPVIGLVHIRNRIEQTRPLRDSDRPALTVWAEGMKEHAKGTQFEMHAEAEVGGEVVWRSVSTYLRKGSGGGGSDKGHEHKHEHEGEGSIPREPKAIWPIPDDIGRRYAAVSGDSNPIHLRRSTAALFGMPRPIAHGMWTKARCLAALEGTLPDALSVDVAFKLPVFLPSKVAFFSWDDSGTRAFELRSAKDGKPHLAGSVTSN